MAAPVQSSTRWITFVYQGTRTVSYIFTPPAGAAATAAVDPTAAVSAAISAGSITAEPAQTVLPVSVGTTVVIATLSGAPVAAAVTSSVSLAPGNAYASARSAASAAAASASAAGLDAAPQDGSSSGGSSGGSSLSQGATIGIGVGAGVGGLILLLGLIACCLCMRRRSKRKEESKYYVHTAEEQEKLASARNSARNSATSSPRNGFATPTFAPMREPGLPKVSEERFAERSAAPAPPAHSSGYVPNNAPAFMGANPPSQGFNNGPRTSSLSPPPGTATRPGSGPPILPASLVAGGGLDDRNRRSTTPRDASPLGPRGNNNPASSRERLPGNNYRADSPARYNPAANAIPVSSNAEAARYMESSGNSRPPRMSSNESPRRSANQSPSRYHQPQMQQQQQQQQQLRPSAPAQNSYSGFDFGTGNQGRGPSPDFRSGNQGRGPSPDPRPTSDRYNIPRRNVGNY